MNVDQRVIDGGIGAWVMSDDRSALIRRVDPPPGEWPRQSGSWSSDERIPVRSERAHRVTLIGESVARGFLLDPVVSLAGLCRTELCAADVEIVDFAVNNLSPDNALTLFRAAVELESSVIVLYLGNNFLRSTPWLGPESRSAVTRTLDVAGYPGYLAARRAATADLARRFRLEIERRCAAAGVGVVVVVPAVNMLDWRSRWVVPTWLPGDRVADWVSTQRRLRGRTDEDRPDLDAETRFGLASRLAELDGCGTPRPLEIVGRELVRRGHAAEGLTLLDNAVSVGADPAAYDRRCPAEVATELRQLAARPGCRLVDVPALLRQRFGPRAFGKDVFLDYCHHTPESLRLIAHEIVTEVTASIGSGVSRRRAPAPVGSTVPADELAASYLLSALHNQHWGQSATTVEHWIGEALRTDPGCVDSMTTYFTMSTPSATFWLTPRRLAEKSERVYWFLKNFSHQPVLDDEFAARCLRVCNDVDRPSPRTQLDAARRCLYVEDLGEVNLLDPFWRDRDGPPRPRTVFTGEKCLATRYDFVATGDTDLCLDIVVTVGPGLRPGDLEVRLNEQTCYVGSVTAEWQTHRIPLPAAMLVHGANTVVIEWPATVRDPLVTRSILSGLGVGPENLDLVRLARVRIRANGPTVGSRS